MATPGQIWRGGVGLERMVWRYAVGHALVVNLALTSATLVLVLNEAPSALIAASLALPVPYNVFLYVGLWRSAARYMGPRSRAELARLGVALWLIFLTLI